MKNYKYIYISLKEHRLCHWDAELPKLDEREQRAPELINYDNPTPPDKKAEESLVLEAAKKKGWHSPKGGKDGSEYAFGDSKFLFQRTTNGEYFMLTGNWSWKLCADLSREVPADLQDEVFNARKSPYENTEAIKKCINDAIQTLGPDRATGNPKSSGKWCEEEFEGAAKKAHYAVMVEGGQHVVYKRDKKGYYRGNAHAGCWENAMENLPRELRSSQSDRIHYAKLWVEYVDAVDSKLSLEDAQDNRAMRSCLQSLSPNTFTWGYKGWYYYYDGVSYYRMLDNATHLRKLISPLKCRWEFSSAVEQDAFWTEARKRQWLSKNRREHQ